VLFEHLGSEIVIIMFVSSANKIELDISDMVLGTSLMHKRRDQVWGLEELHI
jgi:hypothetical protein